MVLCNFEDNDKKKVSKCLEQMYFKNLLGPQLDICGYEI